MKAVAARQKQVLPSEVSITSQSQHWPDDGQGRRLYIAVVMNISVPSMERSALEALVAAAHEVCPYSNATRGNIDVSLNIVDGCSGPPVCASST